METPYVWIRAEYSICSEEAFERCGICVRPSAWDGMLGEIRRAGESTSVFWNEDTAIGEPE